MTPHYNPGDKVSIKSGTTVTGATGGYELTLDGALLDLANAVRAETLREIDAAADSYGYWVRGLREPNGTWEVDNNVDEPERGESFTDAVFKFAIRQTESNESGVE